MGIGKLEVGSRNREMGDQKSQNVLQGKGIKEKLDIERTLLTSLNRILNTAMTQVEFSF